MKHFRNLQNQIEQLERRYTKREETKRNYATNLIETNDDAPKLRAVLKEKNAEIERFRLELDSMLKLLKTLKFQQMFAGK